MTNITVNMDVEDFIDLLNQRKEYVEDHYGWASMPDKLWECFTDGFRCGGAVNAPVNVIVDNVIVNGNWGSFDKYKEEDETDEEFIERIQDSAICIDEEERVVCFEF